MGGILPKGKEIVVIGRRFAVANPTCRREMLLFFSLLRYCDGAPPGGETADNQNKHGGYAPGIGPGGTAAGYLDRVLSRLTAVSGLRLVAVCLLPLVLISDCGLPFYSGGTSIPIIVSVSMDTVTEIRSYLLAHQHEGPIRKARARNRR